VRLMDMESGERVVSAAGLAETEEDNGGSVDGEEAPGEPPEE